MANSNSQLRNLLVLIAVPALVVAAIVGWYLANHVITAELETQAVERLRAVSRRSSALVSRYLEDNGDILGMLVRGPAVIAAARSAGDESARTGLARLPIEDLEERFADTRVLRNDPTLNRYLGSFQEGSDLVEIFFTERHGLNVASTNITSDFVQSDEAWWTTAWETGTFVGTPEFDESAGVVAIELAARVEDPVSGAAVGVAKAALRLGRLAGLIAETGEADDAVIEVVDSTGRVLISRDTTRLLRPSRAAAALTRETGVVVVRADVPGMGPQLVAAAPTAANRWWVVATQSEASAYRVARSIQRIVAITAAIVLVILIASFVGLGAWLRRRYTVPVRSAADIARRVAEGDLSVTVEGAGDQAVAEARQLLTAVENMIHQLRTLVTAIRASAEELAAMAQQISASTEQMSASTEEMAATSQRLSDQASQQSVQVREATGDAERILAIATQLADGARLAAERSGDLRETAEGHRERLVAGSDQLKQLAAEVEKGAEEAKVLATLSSEVQQFVVQAKAIATRTNMLALNAAIEAARAGAEGRGFAVVADEVRKLATQAADAAQTTSDTVSRVLSGVHGAGERLTRLAKESAAVRSVSEEAARGLEEVTERAVEGSAWADEISAAAAEAKRVVEEIVQRLQAITGSTESAAAAIEQIAASAQQQSASTQEVAGSAAHLAEASERLNAGVSRFRLSADPGAGD
jgi:methyl-accepting chemotaxis protein